MGRQAPTKAAAYGEPNLWPVSQRMAWARESFNSTLKKVLSIVEDSLLPGGRPL